MNRFATGPIRRGSRTAYPFRQPANQNKPIYYRDPRRIPPVRKPYNPVPKRPNPFGKKVPLPFSPAMPALRRGFRIVPYLNAALFVYDVYQLWNWWNMGEGAYDFSGWTHVCGPVPLSPSYGTFFWWKNSSGFCGLGNQAPYNPSLATNIVEGEPIPAWWSSAMRLQEPGPFNSARVLESYRRDGAPSPEWKQSIGYPSPVIIPDGAWIPYWEMLPGMPEMPPFVRPIPSRPPYHPYMPSKGDDPVPVNDPLVDPDFPPGLPALPNPETLPGSSVPVWQIDIDPPGGELLPDPGKGPGRRPKPRPRPKPETHRLRPPSAREKEKKRRIGSALLRMFMKVANELTEAVDYIDALYEALPWRERRWKGRDGNWRDRDITPADKLRRIYDTIGHSDREPDLQKFIMNLIENEVEDRIIGRIGNLAKKANRANGWLAGIQAGPLH